jgi:hypothetical protein
MEDFYTKFFSISNYLYFIQEKLKKLNCDSMIVGGGAIKLQIDHNPLYSSSSSKKTKLDDLVKETSDIDVQVFIKDSQLNKISDIINAFYNINNAFFIENYKYYSFYKIEMYIPLKEELNTILPTLNTKGMFKFNNINHKKLTYGVQLQNNTVPYINVILKQLSKDTPNLKNIKFIITTNIYIGRSTFSVDYVIKDTAFNPDYLDEIIINKNSNINLKKINIKSLSIPIQQNLHPNGEKFNVRSLRYEMRQLIYILLLYKLGNETVKNRKTKKEQKNKNRYNALSDLLDKSSKNKNTKNETVKNRKTKKEQKNKNKNKNTKNETVLQKELLDFIGEHNEYSDLLTEKYKKYLESKSINRSRGRSERRSRSRSKGTSESRSRSRSRSGSRSRSRSGSRSRSRSKPTSKKKN